MSAQDLKNRFKKLAGIITEQDDYPGGGGIDPNCIYGCMDPNATNYDPDATCWGDPSAYLIDTTDNSSSYDDYVGVAYGPFYCTYGYSCDTFESWMASLYELGVINNETYGVQFPDSDSPFSQGLSSNDMINYICGGEPNSPEACMDNGTGVCNSSSVNLNPGQYCPACFSAFNFNNVGTGSAGGVDMCDCCCTEEPIPGCTDPNASNYDSFATTDDGSCEYDTPGCTDENAENYDPNATTDDGSCEYIPGCMDPDALNYNPDATISGLPACEYLEGCTDPTALNYNPDAVIDDESCEYLEGCMDPTASNYNPDAVIEDGSCEYIEGCMDPEADNYNPDAVIEDGSCEYPGCTDENAENYDPDANVDDNSCDYLGCTDMDAVNFEDWATIDDGSCDFEGCTDENAFNYDPNATIDDGSCQYSGCTDPEAVNYNPDADISDGSCIYEVTCYQCEYPVSDENELSTVGYVIDQIFNIPGQNANVTCPEDWVNDPDTLNCGGHTIDPELKKYSCKMMGQGSDECIEDVNGAFESMNECLDSGCGQSECYKCEDNSPVGYMYPNPPGCPKGWTEQVLTYEDCRPNCDDSKVIEWLNDFTVTNTHCCEVWYGIGNFADEGTPGPQCYNAWEALDGDPNIDPHYCCPENAMDECEQYWFQWSTANVTDQLVLAICSACYHPDTGDSTQDFTFGTTQGGYNPDGTLNQVTVGCPPEDCCTETLTINNIIGGGMPDPIATGCDAFDNLPQDFQETICTSCEDPNYVNIHCECCEQDDSTDTPEPEGLPALDKKLKQRFKDLAGIKPKK